MRDAEGLGRGGSGCGLSGGGSHAGKFGFGRDWEKLGLRRRRKWYDIPRFFDGFGTDMGAYNTLHV